MGKCTSAPTEHESISKHDIAKCATYEYTIYEEAIYEDANKLPLVPKCTLNNPLINPQDLVISATINLETNPVPRSNIFFTESTFMDKSKLFAFIETYCRLQLSNYKHISIPHDILCLFCNFYDAPQCELPPIPPIVLAGTNNLMSIDDEEEHIFYQLYITDTDWFGNADIMKITVLTNLTITSKSRMACYMGGTIILNVMGDIYIEDGSKLICPDAGNIFIKCNNLYLGTSVDIRTCNWMDNEIVNFEAISNKLDNNNKSTLYGNIHMEIKNDMKMKENNYIQSGNINIDCGGSVECINSSITITALRNDLKINAKQITIINKKGLKARRQLILNEVL